MAKNPIKRGTTRFVTDIAVTSTLFEHRLQDHESLRQRIAGHESRRTTKLYDHQKEEIFRDESSGLRFES
jgi:hypothetical protein